MVSFSRFYLILGQEERLLMMLKDNGKYETTVETLMLPMRVMKRCGVA